MKNIKSFLRLVGLTMLVILSLCGVGFLGALFPTRRDYENKPMNIEQKDESAQDNGEDSARE
ncbi:MAG TPA: hypothetical protein VGD40_07935 [Chryseosolibacter sp.]